MYVYWFYLLNLFMNFNTQEFPWGNTGLKLVYFLITASKKNLQLFYVRCIFL